MNDEPRRAVLTWKIDGLLFVLGCLFVVVAVVDCVRSGASLATTGWRAWAFAGGVVVVVAILGAVGLTSRRFDRLAETDLVRKLRR